MIKTSCNDVTSSLENSGLIFLRTMDFIISVYQSSKFHLSNQI